MHQAGDICPHECDNHFEGVDSLLPEDMSVSEHRDIFDWERSLDLLDFRAVP